jgi:hypothetical protein
MKGPDYRANYALAGRLLPSLIGVEDQPIKGQPMRCSTLPLNEGYCCGACIAKPMKAKIGTHNSHAMGGLWNIDFGHSNLTIASWPMGCKDILEFRIAWPSRHCMEAVVVPWH